MCFLYINGLFIQWSNAFGIMIHVPWLNMVTMRHGHLSHIKGICTMGICHICQSQWMLRITDQNLMIWPRLTKIVGIEPSQILESCTPDARKIELRSCQNPQRKSIKDQWVIKSSEHLHKRRPTLPVDEDQCFFWTIMNNAWGIRGFEHLDLSLCWVFRTFGPWTTF